jgi:hypothetical protein
MGKERALTGSLGVSCSKALQSLVVTNAVVELLALARLSLLTFTSAVNPVNLAARLGNHQRVAAVHNFYVVVAQKNVGGLLDAANPGGMSGNGGSGRARRYGTGGGSVRAGSGGSVPRDHPVATAPGTVPLHPDLGVPGIWMAEN